MREPNEKAAGVTQTPAAARIPQHTPAIVRHDGDPFKRLQVRAARAGMVLLAVGAGFLLIGRDSSDRFESLEAAAAELVGVHG